MLTVSITHPRRIYQVDHVQLPALRFFSDNNSLRLANSQESQGWNTLSRECNRVRRTWLRWWTGLWASPSKFPTKTSM